MLCFCEKNSGRVERMLKIVFPIWNFSKSGGMRVISQLANHMQYMGCEVLMICYYKTILPYYPIECKIIYINDKGRIASPSERIEPNNVFEVINDNYKKVRALRIATDMYAKDFDVAIATANMTAYVVKACNIQSKFYYIQAYEAWEDTNLSFKRKILNRIIAHTYKLNLIRVVNSDLYLNYKEICSNYIVPPGLDLSIYTPKNKEVYWKKERPLIIGCIGRLEEWKGSEDVAIAVDLLQNKGYEIDFRVAFNEVKHSNYKLVKPDGDKNLAEYYRNVDILVAPAKLQLGAIHYPVIEAMACGTPVITTGYYPANNENAYIVPVSSPKEIAQTIEHIMQHYDEAIKKAEKALISISEFDWNKVSEKFITIIMENIGEK